ncbi:MAG TPA: FecR family protein [Blastocatellia bacterium]|nr:FecR family protein [Blastocatellia bacterium]
MRHPQSYLYLLVMTASCLFLTRIELQAQSGNFEARVNKVTGDVQWFSQTRPSVFGIKLNDLLSPGDTIQTGRTGQVVITLTDGSQVTILPGSRVTLKDYRTAHSIRELLEITLGRIRVKIRHVGNQPNPYLLNSPTASIAVRGTEFLVDVQQSGETQVKVLEGLVEVTSSTNPRIKRLVTPGRRAVVKPGGEISLSFPGPGNGFNAIPRYTGDISSAYQTSVKIFVQNSAAPAPTLFTAFMDAHLDSLENPAYASEFTRAKGRLSMLPSISQSDHGEYNEPPGGSTSRGFRPFDYTFNSQATFFTPIPNSRFTVGGGVSAIRTNMNSLWSYRYRTLAGENIDEDFDVTSVKAVNVALIAARRFGSQERTSLGIEVERLSGKSYYHNEYNRNDGGTENQEEMVNNSIAQLARTRLTLGFAREFSGGRKLGIYYRYGATSSDQQNHHYFKSESYSSRFYYDSTAASSTASEIGIRWRGLITKRLFYGLEASSLFERITGRSRFQRQSGFFGGIRLNEQVVENDRARLTRFGGGIGLAIRPKTVVGVDVSGGFSGLTGTRTSAFVSGQEYVGKGEGSFFSAHAGMQTTIWRGAFASASFLTMRRQYSTDFYSELTPYELSPQKSLTKAGAGWRFNPKFLVQYLFSIDHTYRVPNHSVVFRYTFDSRPNNEK